MVRKKAGDRCRRPQRRNGNALEQRGLSGAVSSQHQVHVDEVGTLGLGQRILARMKKTGPNLLEKSRKFLISMESMYIVFAQPVVGHARPSVSEMSGLRM